MSTIVDTWSKVFTTDDFDRWLRKLKDRQGSLRILSRIDRLAQATQVTPRRSARASWNFG